MQFDASLNGRTLPDFENLVDNKEIEPIDPKKFDEALKAARERKLKERR